MISRSVTQVNSRNFLLLNLFRSGTTAFIWISFPLALMWMGMRVPSLGRKNACKTNTTDMSDFKPIKFKLQL